MNYIPVIPVLISINYHHSSTIHIIAVISLDGYGCD